MLKNNKGFTLIEIVVAIGLMVMLGAFTIVSLSAVPQARMRESAQTIKSEFELTRDYAKTHGGNAMISLTKNDEGLLVTRTGENLTEESTQIQDRNFVLYYKITDDETEYKLGEEDFEGNDDVQAVTDKTIKMTFSQTEGKIIGPHMIDYIIISNGSQNYKFIIQQESGMMYYDYELEDGMNGENNINGKTTVKTPSFIVKGRITTDVIEIKQDENGNSVQPEISYDSKKIKIGGVYRAIDVGSYEITFELKDPYSTTWPNGSTETFKLIWKIIP